jgi:hypothetical protein
MEFILAKKLSELDQSELVALLMKLRESDMDAFRALQEAIDDL